MKKKVKKSTSRTRRKNAKGVRGFLLAPITKADKLCYFRVYNKKNKRKFKDYLILATDIEVEIKDPSVTLKRTNKLGPVLDWTDEVLGKKK